MRIIARLDIKGPNLIKAINLEGLKVVGNPNDFAIEYYKGGADELIFMDMVASLYNRNSLHEIIKLASEKIFIPLGAIHRIENPNRNPVRIIEAQLGSILKATDIIRYQDVYGRVS